MNYVYKITNKIDGKMYIGKTNNPSKRFYDHKNHKEYSSISYISRALQCHGPENFIFEIIEENDDPMYIAEREFYYINQLSTISPNGYNLRNQIDGKEVIHETTKNKLSQVNQGRAYGSNTGYVGVCMFNNRIHTSIRINRKVVSRVFSTEIEAAQAYDRLVLYVFGPNAKLNFPNLREQFLAEDLELFYQNFIKTYYKSSYHYVSPNKNKKNPKWRVRVDSLNIPDILKVPFMPTEIDAAETVDKLILYYNLPKTMNFPDKIYDMEGFAELINSWKLRAIKSSPHIGVSYKKKNNRWRAYTYVDRKYIDIGEYDTEQEAVDARNKYFLTVRGNVIH